MLDFWNDPNRWDGVDPNKECFWMKRKRDVIDVREKTRSGIDALASMRGMGASMSSLAQLQNAHVMSQAAYYNQLQNAFRPGSILPYSPQGNSLIPGVWP